MSKRQTAGEADLEFYYAEGPSLLGERSTFRGGGGVGGARDIDGEMADLMDRSGSKLARLQRIDDVIVTMSPRHLRVARAAFGAPRRWTPNTGGSDSTPDRVADFTRRRGRAGCLAGVCLMTAALRAAWTARQVKLKLEPVPATDAMLRALMTYEAGTAGARKFFAPIMREAEAMLGEAAAEYETRAAGRLEAWGGRRLMAAPQLEELATIRGLAAERHIHIRTMRRTLDALLRRDLDQGLDRWMVKLPYGPKVVNRSLLRRLHPELFAHKAPRMVDVEELQKEVAELRKAQNALAARFRHASNAWLSRDRSGQIDPSRAP